MQASTPLRRTTRPSTRCARRPPAQPVRCRSPSRSSATVPAATSSAFRRTSAWAGARERPPTRSSSSSRRRGACGRPMARRWRSATTPATGRSACSSRPPRPSSGGSGRSRSPASAPIRATVARRARPGCLTAFPTATTPRSCCVGSRGRCHCGAAWWASRRVTRGCPPCSWRWRACATSRASWCLAASRSRRPTARMRGRCRRSAPASCTASSRSRRRPISAAARVRRPAGAASSSARPRPPRSWARRSDCRCPTRHSPPAASQSGATSPRDPPAPWWGSPRPAGPRATSSRRRASPTRSPSTPRSAARRTCCSTCRRSPTPPVCHSRPWMTGSR